MFRIRRNEAQQPGIRAAWRPKGLRARSAAATLLLIAGAFVAPSHHTTVTGGPLYDAMGQYQGQDVLTVQEQKATTGEIYVLSLRATGIPGGSADSGAQAFTAWLALSSASSGYQYLAVPTELMYPHGASNADTQNPDAARLAAQNYLGRPVQVQVNVPEANSQDLMLTLAMINKLSAEKLMADPPDLSQPVNRREVNIYRDRLTGSARVNADGTVHSAGALEYKLRAAGENFAPYFIIAQEDCEQLAHIKPSSRMYIRDRTDGIPYYEEIRIIPVSTVDGAVQAMRLIRDSKDNELPRCS
ncbi:MAG: hypothetical protein Q4P78_07650 [Rothia sp. (in: high G+C Gram-positive bacteria)]|uniref:hypothetical protein n=1 Tax=Rothia sp. (in: high G+C Gram-positive bacteria) TaxID=1885016 RepID=UPI0026E0A1E3|nr:hypothetical protein [Rothia sp. (in: high G+C Gram-positive bacteria)]MDO5751052.1 hypothetical protein [Rothia sp. (in: high G+C Gram-positive bacteria)]